MPSIGLGRNYFISYLVRVGIIKFEAVVPFSLTIDSYYMSNFVSEIRSSAYFVVSRSHISGKRF